MYGMTGKLVAQPGQRQAFVQILLRAARLVGSLPGCRLYAVAEDLADDVTIWVMEIWDDKAAHDASLQNSEVQALISEGRSLMGGAPDGAELRIAGGHGVPVE